jgi:hypothetical protein
LGEGEQSGEERLSWNKKKRKVIPVTGRGGEVNSEILPQFCCDRFLPNPFRFFVDKASFHLTLYNWTADSVISASRESNLSVLYLDGARFESWLGHQLF